MKDTRRRVEETSDVAPGDPHDMKVVEDKTQPRIVWPTTPSPDFIYKRTSTRIRGLAAAVRGE